MRQLGWTAQDSLPVPSPRSACPSGKLGWFSEADARLAIEYACRRHADRIASGGRRPRGVYACESCPSWHITGRLMEGRGDV